MKSPFPGMDPYLERHWRDVHGTIIVHARAALQKQLGGGLRARIEERLIVESPLDEPREIYPDLRVFERGLPGRPMAAAATSTVAEPFVIKPARPKAPQRFIEIIDVSSGGRLVTVIEFVSPSNKSGTDAREKFLRKRDEVVAADVNLVEIDLTRAGHRDVPYPEDRLPNDARHSTYVAYVFRGHGADQYELYPIRLQEPLPAIRIPLRDSDPDVALELQRLIEQTYVDGA